MIAGQGSNGAHVSFRDKVLRGTSMPPRDLPANLIQQKLARVLCLEEDGKVPRVRFEKEVLKKLAIPWKDTLVIKLLGRHLSYPFMKGKLKTLWRLKGGYELMSAGFGYFSAKFDLSEDREKVMVGGPWMIQDQYLAVKQRSPDFSVCEESFGRTMVWVHFTKLNMMFYDECAIRVIASAVGRPVKIDVTTKSVERGRFTRACVEVDLAIPVKRKVLVEDRLFSVEYESLHMVYGLCDRYGHLARDYVLCSEGGFARKIIVGVLGEDTRERKWERAKITVCL